MSKINGCHHGSMTFAEDGSTYLKIGPYDDSAKITSTGTGLWYVNKHNLYFRDIEEAYQVLNNLWSNADDHFTILNENNYTSIYNKTKVPLK